MFGIAGAAGIARPPAMGAKYIPSIKDQKAAVRFLKKQNPPPNYKKSSDAPAARNSAAPEKPAAKPAG